jgi:2'-5' RNA ligase
MEKDPKVIRTFIAIDVSEEVKKDLENLQQTFMPYATGIRWVRPEGIHLTLKFLGNVAIDRIPDIESALVNVARDHTPFRLKPKGCGAFPSLKNIRVLWVGLDGDLDQVRKLYGDIENAMEQLGFPREERDFKPHLTLGRAKSVTRNDRISKALATSLNFESSPFLVEEVILFKSTLTPSGSVYTRLSVIKLSR